MLRYLDVVRAVAQFLCIWIRSSAKDNSLWGAPFICGNNNDLVSPFIQINQREDVCSMVGCSMM